MALLHCEADVKDNDHVIFFNMRHYPVDWVWFRRLLEKLELTDIPLVVRHLGRIALIGARWSDSAESIDCTETAVIEHTDDQFVDTGLTDNVLRLVGANFSLRYFNKLSFARAGYFRKSSLNITKIRAEYDFLSTLPAEVRPFYPAVGDLCETEGEGEYEVEIIPAFDVAKLLMHGRFAESRIIDAFMAEALVKTFKRDYVFCNDRPDAETVVAQLPGWFEDYNENAPHKALRILSPREFIRSVQNLKCPI